MDSLANGTRDRHAGASFGDREHVRRRLDRIALDQVESQDERALPDSVRLRTDRRRRPRRRHRAAAGAAWPAALVSGAKKGTVPLSSKGQSPFSHRGRHTDIIRAMSDVTQILDAAKRGDPQAAAQLLPLVYDELRRLAAAKLAHEKPGQTLDATALVHEAYLRLVGPAASARWENPGHFFAAASQPMRRLLSSAARRHNHPPHRCRPRPT